jgi:superfamily II DNA/RNA helicase
MEFKNNNGPFLVVVPLSTLSNWVNEFNKWAPSIVKVVYKGPPEQRKKIFRDEIETKMMNALITTYEYVMRDKNSLRRVTWQYIIVDEGHRMKNAQSKFAQTLGNIYTSKHRVLLTGTPLQNNLPELWALLNFLLPTIFSSVETFDQWFNKPFAAFRTIAMTGNEDNMEDHANNNLTQEERMLIVHRLHELLRPFVLRRVKSQVLDQMPQRIEKVVKCPLSALQFRMYHSIISKGLNVPAANSNIPGIDALSSAGSGGLNNAIMQLKKVCNHPFLFLKEYLIDEDIIRSSGKFELLNRMLPKLKAAGHRVLLFSQMVEVMNVMEQMFNMKGYLFLRLDGTTSSDERERRMYAFNDPCSPYFIFLLSTRAGGLGLNLATADTVIIFDSDWNPMVDAQAQGRAHRIGQKNEVRVYRILTHSPIEERIYSKATSKKNLTEIVVEAGKFNSRVSTSLEDNKEMMESLLNEYSNLTQETLERDFSDYQSYLQECDVPDNEELNEMMSTYEGEFDLFQEIDTQFQHLHVNHSDPKQNLLQVNQLPSWMNAECWHPKFIMLMNDVMNQQSKQSKKRSLDKCQQSKSVEESYGVNDDDVVEDSGKGMRKRREVMYDDGLTDLQFARMIERQQDDKSVPPNKQTESNNNTKPKRGVSHLHPIVQAIIKVISDIQKIKRDDGTLLAALFLEKPAKSIYPDYYQIISRPISLKEITQKLRKGEYEYYELIELDFALMSDNARIFNTEESPVFGMCETVRQEFYKRTRQILLEYSITPLSGTQMMPVLPPVGFDIYPKSKSFTGHLLPKDDPAPKSKRAKTNNNSKMKSNKNSSLSLSLSLSQQRLVERDETDEYLCDEDVLLDDVDDEDIDSGLVFTLATRK